MWYRRHLETKKNKEKQYQRDVLVIITLVNIFEFVGRPKSGQSQPKATNVRQPEPDVTGMTRNAPSRLPLRNRNTSGEIGYDYSHFGEEDPLARLPKPRPDS